MIKRKNILLFFTIIVITTIVLAYNKFFTFAKNVGLERYPDYPATMAILLIIFTYIFSLLFTYPIIKIVLSRKKILEWL